MVYVLVLQFQIVAFGTQRQIAMSTDRRVTRLDARARAAARRPAAPAQRDRRSRRSARDVVVDRRSLTPTAGALARSTRCRRCCRTARRRCCSPAAAATTRPGARPRSSGARCSPQQARLRRRAGAVPFGASTTSMPATAALGLSLGAQRPAARRARVATATEPVRLLAQRRARRRRGDSTLPTTRCDWALSTDGERRRIDAHGARAGLKEQPRHVIAELRDSIARRGRRSSRRRPLLGARRRRRAWSGTTARATPGAPVPGRRAAGLSTARASTTRCARRWRSRPARCCCRRGRRRLRRGARCTPSDRAHVRRLRAARHRPLRRRRRRLAAAVRRPSRRCCGAASRRPSLRLVDYLHRKARRPAGAPSRTLPAAWAPWVQLTRDTFAACARGAGARAAGARR